MIKRVIILAFGLILSCQIMAQKTHTVKSGETLSAIARDNGTTVGDIMRMNGMNADSKLNVGDKIKIPSTGITVERGKTHTIQSGETLTKIAETYGTTVGDIMRLNGMNADSKLTVGEAIKIPESGVTIVRKESNVPVATAEETPQNSAVVYQNTAEQNADIFAPPTTAAANESFYATSYRTSGEEMRTAGSAKIFKTESGWNDHKYFILMNDIQPGRVVKVENPQTNNIIYAKVLWNLGSGKENQGLTYRISDAAAQSLGINNDKFDLSVTYFK